MNQFKITSLSKNLLLVFCFSLFIQFNISAQYQMENLDRGVVAMRRSNDNYITWRMLGTESMNVSYNIYRNGTKINTNPITTTTNYVDAGGNTSSTYSVSAIVNGVEGTQSTPVATWSNFYKEIGLNKPAGGTSPDGVVYDYAPNDATVADLDGDGQYEIIFKWSPSNAHDNAHDGYTGVTYIEAVKLNGTRMWRINLGINIRSGAHYVEMQAYDFDGDGKAEVALRTADGTIDGQGKVIGSATADYRSNVGRVLSGPEFLTMFNGETGAAMSTVNYVPGRGNVSDWGDGYGNRVDRFLSGVAHLGGSGNPSLLMCRGYYTRMVVAAWDFKNGQLVQRWTFDTNNNMNHLRGKGNHQISIADVDGDGKQEIIYGAVVIDDNGAPLNYNTWGHGDALHVGDFDLNNPGIEIFMPIEYASSNPSDQRPGFVMRDGKTGNILWQVFRDGDIGRGNCANIDSRYPGAECYASGGAGLYSAQGQVIGNTPSGCNFSIWWDGDFTRELLDGTKLDNWNESGNGSNARLFTIYNTATATDINGTKANPNLSADLIGDWREEMIYHSSDNTKLIVFTTNIETNHKLYTLMHDPQYRAAIAWQSTGYNQPPHPSFYIGEDMAAAPIPNITLVGGNAADCNGVKNGGAYLDECGICVGGNTGKQACVLDCNGTANGTASVDECGVCSGGSTGVTACSAAIQGEGFCSADGILESTNTGFQGEGYLNFNNVLGSSASWTIVSAGNQTVQLGFRYSNGGTTARGLNVLINGNQQGSITGNTTGGWTTWNVSFVTVNLQNGVNTITLTATSADGGPNLDLISLSNSNVNSGSCTTDCNGVFGGSAFVDNCGTCVSGNTGLEACVQDCNGDWGGSAILDNCNTCIGGNSGNNACVKDCAGEWGGTTVEDDCGVCGGNNACLDCNGELNGTAILDNCGQCVGGSTENNACTFVMELEDGCFFDGITETINGGFTGSSYVNLNNAIATTLTFDITSNLDQTVVLLIRYANGSTTNRPVKVLLNESVIIPSLDFPNTGAWTTWGYVSIELPLAEGSNFISLESLTADGGVNYDAVSTSTSGLTKGACTITSVTNLKELGVELYPNPYTNKFTLEVDVLTQYRITSIKGELLEEGVCDTKCDLGESLQAGGYLIEIGRGNKYKTVKLIKN